MALLFLFVIRSISNSPNLIIKLGHQCIEKPSSISVHFVKNRYKKAFFVAAKILHTRLLESLLYNETNEDNNFFWRKLSKLVFEYTQYIQISELVNIGSVRQLSPPFLFQAGSTMKVGQSVIYSIGVVLFSDLGYEYSDLVKISWCVAKCDTFYWGHGAESCGGPGNVSRGIGSPLNSLICICYYLGP